MDLILRATVRVSRPRPDLAPSGDTGESVRRHVLLTQRRGTDPVLRETAARRPILRHHAPLAATCIACGSLGLVDGMP